MPNTNAANLWASICKVGGLSARNIAGSQQSITLAELATASLLGPALQSLRAKSVLLAVRDQLTAALALVELDGIARRLVLCPPGLTAGQLAAVASTAECTAAVVDVETRELVPADLAICEIASASLTQLGHPRDAHSPNSSEWVLLTSGTSGPPKLALHSLASLTGAISTAAMAQPAPVWSTFYDIRRYGGLQIFLRGLLGGGSLVLSNADEPVSAFLARLQSAAVTHISGTPSHWRRALMSPDLHMFRPQYIRLSGEVVDQSILDHLRAAFPGVSIAHAFASTEAGVAFDVADGLSGFPARLLDAAAGGSVAKGGVEMKVENGSLHIRSNRTANRYLGENAPALKSVDGFVDTGDIILRQGERCHFAGRRGGIINVGGAKVHPEEVEAVITRHPAVQMAQVKPRKNPVTGAVVVADVVLRPSAGDGLQLSQEIICLCREALDAHKVPVMIRIVTAIDVGQSGKLVRHNG